MMTRIRGGVGASSVGRRRFAASWSTFAVLGGMLAGLSPAPCGAQQPSPSAPSSGGNPTVVGNAPGPPNMVGAPGTPIGQPPGAGLGTSPTGAQPLPFGTPGLPGVGTLQPSTEGAESMYSNLAGGVQPPPIPLPIREEAPQPPGPLPLANLMRLPSITADHYGDGSGTVGAGLIWMGQLPHQYRISRFEDGNGLVGGPITQRQWITPHSTSTRDKGTLSYGPPGLHPGFFGFGLSFHPGYGYGGNGLGVGALGGYPCYGGPGYPLHYGYPKFAACPFYEGIGQLYLDQPVVVTELVGAGDFGPYTGASAYAYTHPSYAAEAAATGSIIPGNASFPDTSATNPSPEATFTPPESRAPGAGAMNPPVVDSPFLGMTLTPVTGADGRNGLRIDRLIPGSTAANAGLQGGDILLSIDGRPVSSRRDLDAVIAGSAPGQVLNLDVVKASDGQERAITIRMP